MCIHIIDPLFLGFYKYCQTLYLSVITAVLLGIQHTILYFMACGQTSLIWSTWTGYNNHKCIYIHSNYGYPSEYCAKSSVTARVNKGLELRSRTIIYTLSWATKLNTDQKSKWYVFCTLPPVQSHLGQQLGLRSRTCLHQ